MREMIEVKKMTREQKLMAMEAIWEELQKDGGPIDSPDWHKNALRETEVRYEAGDEKSLDWQEAKKQLRKRFE